jgi:SAM-dependent methyltransferase
MTSAVVALFLFVFALLMLSIRALAISGVPVRSAGPEAVAAALDLLALRDGERFADLGCGSGQVLRAARHRADVEARGWELNPAIWALALLRSDRRTRVRLGDFRKARHDDVDAAYCYLMPAVMAREAAWLEGALRPGARLVSVDFAVPGWTPEEVREVGPLRQPLHLYRMGRHRGPG